MPLHPEVLAKLRCPLTRQKLVLSESGLTTEDGRYRYPIEEGFPVLTADAAIDINATESEISWDDSYQSGQTPWDKGQPAPPLTAYLAENPTALTGKIFVPGCGLGHDARALAHHGAQVTALDISPTAIEQAKALAAAENSPPIEFILGDLFHLPSALVGSFDWVFEHTCLSGLPPHLRPHYFEAVTAALKPGGKLFAIWFVNPDMDPGEPGPPFGIPLTEVQNLTAHHFTLLENFTPTNSFEGRELREQLQILQKK